MRRYLSAAVLVPLVPVMLGAIWGLLAWNRVADWIEGNGK